MRKIVIIGGGTAGTMMANHLINRIDLKKWQIQLIDGESDHYYQPGFLFLPFSIYQKKDIIRPKASFLPSKINWIQEEADQIYPEKDKIKLKSGKEIPYDILIIATGSKIVPGETPGLLEAGWRRNIFDFYSIDGAVALEPAIRTFQGGDLVVHITEMPIKCPVAPLEFAFLADWFFSQKGLRNKTNITYVTPLSGAFTKPVAAKALGHLLAEKNIRVESDFNIEKVNGDTNEIQGFDGRKIHYDLLVTVPTNMGDDLIARSGLGDELNFVPVNKHTLQAKANANIFVLGDATDVPTSKAGSVAHFQAELLIENILRFMKNLPLEESFDGHANCFIESGFKRGLLIDFNYDHEPVPGKFPFAGLGPLSLLKENRINHWGKLSFKWIYWNILLKARKIPGVPARMKLSGKRFPANQVEGE